MVGGDVVGGEVGEDGFDAGEGAVGVGDEAVFGEAAPVGRGVVDGSLEVAVADGDGVGGGLSAEVDELFGGGVAGPGFVGGEAAGVAVGLDVGGGFEGGAGGADGGEGVDDGGEGVPEVGVLVEVVGGGAEHPEAVEEVARHRGAGV